MIERTIVEIDAARLSAVAGLPRVLVIPGMTAVRLSEG
jgi:hypothetical protein